MKSNNGTFKIFVAPRLLREFKIKRPKKGLVFCGYIPRGYQTVYAKCKLLRPGKVCPDLWLLQCRIKADPKLKGGKNDTTKKARKK